jgi:multiple sugar transport system ATP-binding protein
MIDIRLENIVKKYENGFQAVNGLSIDIPKNKFIVLLGPSGCGKSTILRMIAGLEEVSSGDIFFDNQNVNNLAPKDRKIGMVFQNYALYPHLSVFENIAFPLKVLKIEKTEIEIEVNRIAELLNLKGMLERKPKQLSGGQRQRVALGRAMIRKPSIFLFDEPLSNLDAQLRVQMRNEIINLHRSINTTSIYVTHDQTEAMTMADEIVILKDGLVQQIASPDKIYNYPNNIFVAKFIGSPSINIIPKNSFLVNYDIADLDININSLEEAVNIAIRPENLEITKIQSSIDEICNMQITNIENMGYEYLVYFKDNKMTNIDDYYILRISKEKFNFTSNLEIGKYISVKPKQDTLLFYNDLDELI